MNARYTVIIALLALATLKAQGQEPTAPEHPDYQAVSGISGNLSSTGSDTMANLMTLWAESFKRLYPSVNIQIQAAGSSTAAPEIGRAHV